MDFALSPNWHLERISAKHHSICFEDLFGTGAAPKLAYSFGTILSPRAGVSYSFTKNKTLLLP
jgi:iron complex outermembrane receptor protein